VAAVVVLASLLVRYNRLVEQANQSTKLAKDVWDSVSSRFSVIDTRIIDLMAKVDVLTARSGLSQASPATRVVSVPAATGPLPAKAVQSSVARPALSVGEGTETEVKVLGLLVLGPKSSAQIKEVVGRSREHTARLMKTLFDRGLVVRNDAHKPYVYEITESGKAYLGS